jgi:hypothetical protein
MFDPVDVLVVPVTTLIVLDPKPHQTAFSMHLQSLRAVRLMRDKALLDIRERE